MSKTISDVFEEHCGHLKFDAKLAMKVNSFQVGFVNRNEEHMTFFGGNLTGVQVVRFTTHDKDSWFTDIMEVDDLALEEDLDALPSVNPEFKVSSNVFNQACCWMIHKFLNSPLLGDKEKHQAMLDCALVLYYRYLTSLLFRYFKYPASQEVAAMTYAQFSYKFELKQEGSWYGLLVSRSNKLIAQNSIHYKTFKNYNNDQAIIYLLNDSQGRIRDILKNIYSVFRRVVDSGSKIKVTSALIEHDGEQILKDSTKNLSSYIRYLHSIVSDESSFVKDDIVELIARILKTMPAKMLRKTLAWCSINHKHVHVKEVEDLIDMTLVHSFGYLANNRNTIKDTSDLPLLISKLRGVYTSSRSTDPELLAMREKAQFIVRQATGSKNDSLVASIRTGLLLYITIRAFTMHHYSGK